MDSCHSCFQRKWVRSCIILLYLFLATSLLTSFLMKPSGIQKMLKLISNYWLGVLLYILLVLGIADILRLILKQVSFPYKEKVFSRKGHAITGAICVLIIFMFSITGLIQAQVIQTTDYKITIDKKVKGIDSLNVVLIADLHLGYNTGNQRIKKMVEEINAKHPDLVVIAGDIFDNEYEAIYEPDKIAETLSTIKTTYGVYACYGNHDIQEKNLAGFTFKGEKKKVSAPEMDLFLKKANIKLLKEEGILIENAFYLYGRPDYERPGRGITKRLKPMEITAEMDKKKPIFVIDHEPRELQELSDAGADLDLCGHTHAGQMFPGNLIIKHLWENSYGYMRKGDLHQIVTSGIGVFGPNMRVGTKSEICRIHVNFQ